MTFLFFHDVGVTSTLYLRMVTFPFVLFPTNNYNLFCLETWEDKRLISFLSDSYVPVICNSGEVFLSLAKETKGLALVLFAEFSRLEGRAELIAINVYCQ